MSVSHVAGSEVSVAGASTVRCIAVLRANQCARGWLVWLVECLKRSPSATGVAVFVFGVNVWTLSVVPVAFLVLPTRCVGVTLVSPWGHLGACK